MATFSLATYSIRVREKRTDTKLRVDNFGPNYDLFDIFDRYFSGLKVSLSHHSAQRRLIRVKSIYRNNQAREIEGILETGEYGYESDLYDVGAQKRSYQKKSSEAEMLPFYFLVSLPQGRDEGLLILQRFKAFGVRKILLDDFMKFFHGLNTDFVISIPPLIPEAVVRSWISEGKVSTIKFVQFNLQSDVADAFSIRDHEEVTSELVIKVKHRGSAALSRLSNRFFGRRLSDRVIELGGGNFEFDTVKMEVQLGDSRRTVDVLNPGKARAFHDITDHVEMERSGHPKFDSISKQAHSLLQDHFSALGFRE